MFKNEGGRGVKGRLNNVKKNRRFVNICANICIFRIFLQLEENGGPRRVKDHTFSYFSVHPCLTVLHPSKMAFLISVTDPTSISTGECQNVLELCKSFLSSLLCLHLRLTPHQLAPNIPWPRVASICGRLILHSMFTLLHASIMWKWNGYF